MSREILKIKNGKVVATYDSVVEASKKNYLDRTTIYRRIRAGHIDKEGYSFALAPFTQFDRIKSMSVEEMTNFICSIWEDDTYYAKRIEGHTFPLYTHSDIKEWLESEAEINDN